MCEKKRRFGDKDLKHVRMAFLVYQRFYEINYRSKKLKTYDQFIDSRFYIPFVTFGRYLQDINAINPMAFVDFLIKLGLPIDKWKSPTVYETYIRELNKRESPDAAVERNILLMQQWSSESGEHWTDFFRKVKPPLATLWIRSGRISPWVLFVASSAAELFGRMSDEQMQIVESVLDPGFWGEKLENHKEEVEHIRSILDEAGV